MVFVCNQLDYNRDMSKKTTTTLSLNPFSLLGETLSIFKANLAKILLISGIVAIPGAILRITSFDNGVTDFSIVASLAGLYASLALLFAFYNPKNIRSQSWSNIYVTASRRFLPFLGVTIIQSLVGMFVILGGLLPVLYLAGVVAIPFALVGIIFALLALWLLIRLSIAGIIVATTEMTALTSLRASMMGTKKRWWKIFFDWLVVFVLATIISGIILRIVYMVPSLGDNQIVLACVNGILVTILLPVLLGYGVCIWQRIQAA